MSKIAITLTETAIDSSSLFKIKSLTKVSLGELKDKIENKEPLYTGVLFYNDHEDMAMLLKKIIHLLDEIQLSYSIYEIEEEATVWDENQRITKSVLFRILDCHEDEMQRQQGMG